MKTIREQQEAGMTVVVCMIMALLCIICGVAFGADDCQDPEKLTPQLREAYYELKELLKDEDGVDVSIRCSTLIGEVKGEYNADEN